MESLIVACRDCGVKNRIATLKMHLQPKCGKCTTPLDVRNYAEPVSLTDATMDTFIKNENIPVMVDFFSPTCGPCQSLAPVLKQMAKQYFGKVIIAKVDTSVNPGCSAYYKIRGVPTLIFFKDGSIIEQITGLPEVSVLEAKLKHFSSS